MEVVYHPALMERPRYFGFHPMAWALALPAACVGLSVVTALFGGGWTQCLLVGLAAPGGVLTLWRSIERRTGDPEVPTLWIESLAYETSYVSHGGPRR